MLESLEYITLFLPLNDQLGNDQDHSINPEVHAYLNENVGLGAKGWFDWQLGAENREHEWCYVGVGFNPDVGDREPKRIFHFRDESKALLFKLRYGGM